MSKLEGPKFVKALYSFKGKNNDELCFKKGDIIAITQTDDGGWWEGTFYDKTGWFPSNYAMEYRDPNLSPINTSAEKSSPESSLLLKINRDIVLKDIVDSERINVAELQGLVTNFLLPLESSNVLKQEEYNQLLGNIQEILEAHQSLLMNLEATIAQGSLARVGNLFLMLAPRLKSLHVLYCHNHPQAVCILDAHRDELNDFMERGGAVSPGILVLTTGLSKPFRRLDKYSGMLQELERHTDKNHPDRGDTQRSITVYREIVDSCASMRKQRELALQILNSGIRGWEGEELRSLGEILHVGSVTLLMGMDRRDRYFILFPTTLLVLGTSPRISSFVYEGKLPLTGIQVIVTEDTEDIQNAFEIIGTMIENIIVLCGSKEERRRWIELLVQDHKVSPLKSPTTPRTSQKPQRPSTNNCTSPGNKKFWSITSLRPAPPMYIAKNFTKTENNTDTSRLPSLCNERQFEEDAMILKVIESYCFTGNARLTVHSTESNGMLDYESPSKSRDRASLRANKSENWDSYNERHLSETVKTLKNQMTDLQLQMSLLIKQLDEERRSRISLAAAVKRNISINDSSPS